MPRNMYSTSNCGLAKFARGGGIHDGSLLTETGLSSRFPPLSRMTAACKPCKKSPGPRPPTRPYTQPLTTRTGAAAHWLGDQRRGVQAVGAEIRKVTWQFSSFQMLLPALLVFNSTGVTMPWEIGTVMTVRATKNLCSPGGAAMRSNDEPRLVIWTMSAPPNRPSPTRRTATSPNSELGDKEKSAKPLAEPSGSGSRMANLRPSESTEKQPHSVAIKRSIGQFAIQNRRCVFWLSVFINVINRLTCIRPEIAG